MQPQERNQDDAKPQQPTAEAVLQAAKKKESESNIQTSTLATRELESLVATLFAAINEQAYERLEELAVDHVSPDFKVKSDEGLIATWNQYIQFQKLWFSEHPGWKNIVNSIEAEVNELHGSATVYIQSDILGWTEEEIRIPSVTVHKWKKRSGKWVAFEATTLRVPGVASIDS